MQLGQGSLMAKFDVQNAYRIEPVHTKDRQLLHGYEMIWSFLLVSGQLHISSHV